MKKNLIPLVMIAFVVALISTAVFYGLMAGRMEGKPNVPVKMSVVASRKLEAGRILRAEDLRLAPSTESGVLAPEHLEDVLGRKLKKNMEAGRAIPEAMLSAPEERLLSGGIPSGMRAVTIHVSDSTGVMRLLKAGDRVDVQSVVQRQKQGESEVEVSTILQNVIVYQALADSAASQNGRQVLTLISSPQDAERLVAADTAGRLRVLLRNHKDEEIVPLPQPTLQSRSTPQQALVQSQFHPGTFLGPTDLALTVWDVENAALNQTVMTDSLQVSPSSLNLAELQKAKRAAILSSSRVAAGRSGELSWRAKDSATMKVLVEPLGNSLEGLVLKIKPEAQVAGKTRRAESTVQIGPRQTALVSGWGKNKNTEGRTVLVAIQRLGER